MVTLCEICVNCPPAYMCPVGGSSGALPSLLASNPIFPSLFLHSISHLHCFAFWPLIISCRPVVHFLLSLSGVCNTVDFTVRVCVFVCVGRPSFIISAFRSELASPENKRDKLIELHGHFSVIPLFECFRRKETSFHI